MSTPYPVGEALTDLLPTASVAKYWDEMSGAGRAGLAGLEMASLFVPVRFQPKFLPKSPVKIRSPLTTVWDPQLKTMKPGVQSPVSKKTGPTFVKDVLVEPDLPVFKDRGGKTLASESVESRIAIAVSYTHLTLPTICSV